MGPSFTSLEHLLVATTAALCDQTVDFVVSDSAADTVADTVTTAAVIDTQNKLVLEQVTTDAWTTARTHTKSMGWMGATRALFGSSADAVAESWLEAAHQTFVVSYQQQPATPGTYTVLHSLYPDDDSRTLPTYLPTYLVLFALH